MYSSRQFARENIEYSDEEYSLSRLEISIPDRLEFPMICDSRDAIYFECLGVIFFVLSMKKSQFPSSFGEKSL